MPPRWQMPDGSWKPLYFDLDHFPPELWVDPNSEGPQSPGEVPPGTRSPRDVPHGPRPAGDPPPDAPTPRERSEDNSDAAASDE
jgi:hypothetical protein